MAYVHTSVNTMSKAYLANERRYNYTTPKSYLEQISLYAKLVNNKTDELRAKIVRYVVHKCLRNLYAGNSTNKQKLESR